MEASDPFATDTGADPFAEPEPATPPPPAPTPAPAAADVPVAPAAPTPTAADMEPTPPPAPDAAPPVVNREGEPVDAPAPQPQPPAPQPPAEPAQPPAETPAAPPAAPTPPPAAQTGGEPAANNGNGEPAKAPKDGDPPKGYRHYVVLYQTGPSTFELVDLKSKLPAHKDYVVKVTEPADKEGQPDVTNWYLQARNNDHAYRLCFTLFDRPANGVTVLPLPRASWRPRRVAPAPPAPERERLVIS